jgi:hypothetical protein
MTINELPQRLAVGMRERHVVHLVGVVVRVVAAARAVDQLVEHHEVARFDRVS